MSIVAALCCGATAVAQPLRGPIDRAARQATLGVTNPPFACPPLSPWRGRWVRERAPPRVRGRVERWLRALVHTVTPHYAQSNTTGTRNNHLNWAALAALAVAAATDDRTLFDWGVERRALGPLLLGARIAAANGVDLHTERDRALSRLATRTVRGLDDPDGLARLAGERQTFDDAGGTRPGPSQLAWGEIWYADARDPALLPWRHARPLREERLGGDLTLAYGVVPLP